MNYPHEWADRPALIVSFAIAASLIEFSTVMRLLGWVSVGTVA